MSNTLKKSWQRLTAPLFYDGSEDKPIANSDLSDGAMSAQAYETISGTSGVVPTNSNNGEPSTKDAASKPEVLPRGLELPATCHELRTPLNAIVGFAALLKSIETERGQSEKTQGYIESIEASADHLLALVEQLAAYSNVDVAAKNNGKQTVSVSSRLSKLRNQMQPQLADKSQRLLIGNCEELPELDIAQLAFDQIMINLISNASKFSGSGSDIHIEVERTATSVKIAIVDTGMGIASQDIKRLGEPFFRTDNVQPSSGAGLGLAIVKNLANNFGCKLNIESRQGVGSRFEVKFPIARNVRPVPSNPNGEILHFRLNKKQMTADQSVPLAQVI